MHIRKDTDYIHMQQLSPLSTVNTCHLQEVLIKKGFNIRFSE